MKAKELKRLEDKLYDELRQQIDIIFAMNTKPLQEFADDCGLHYATVWRYWWGEFQYPKIQTVQKLAHGVGLDVHLTQDGVTASLSKAKKSKKQLAETA